MKNFQNDIPPMLDAGIKVLVYAGEYDYIVNWYGCYNWVTNLDSWSDINKWNAASNNSWSINNNIVGYSQSYGGLTFLKVLNAGHMVPMDQPSVALNMINTFTIGNGW